VRTSDFQASISKICDERDDDWGKMVAIRMAYVIDLHAADALYHQQCRVSFSYSGKNTKWNLSSSAKRVNCGRPEDLDRSDAHSARPSAITEKMMRSN